MHFLHTYTLHLREPGDNLALTLGQWPCLQSLTFHNFPVCRRDVAVFIQVDWLKVTKFRLH